MLKFLSVLFHPSRLFQLVTVERLQRLWFYAQTGQFSIINHRVARLLHQDSSSLRLSLYAENNLPARLDFPNLENPLVSIIVPVYNQWSTTHSCLTAILENSGDIPYEVIVADDNSTDETRNISLYATNVRTIVNPANLGFLRNCNNAASWAAGRYLVFLNNDTNVQPGWLEALVELMERDSSVGMAGSKLLYPDGRLQEAGGIVWQDGGGWNYGRMDSPERPEYNYLKEVDYVSGASLMVRKALWEQIGGFDERYVPAYYEDTDLAFEVRRHGYKVMLEPRSLVVHFEGISHGKDAHSGVKAHQVVNKEKFRAKWRDILDAEQEKGVLDIFLARDRSARKRTLLFIDHCVPMFDRDAGSKSTLQYLELMVEMGYNVKFLGNSFHPYQPYTEALQKMGIEVIYGPWYQSNWKKWISHHGRHFDYVYLSRPDIALKYLAHIKAHTAAKILYCGHDLHYLRAARQYELEGNHAHLKSSRKWKEIETKVINGVDVSYFFSDFEVHELDKQFPSCVARAIPLLLFDKSELNVEGTPDFAARNGLFFVGNFLHTPNIDAMRWFVEEVFPLIRARLPDIEFTVAGSNPPSEIKALEGDGVIFTGRLSDEELRQQYRKRRVVVAPLRYGAGVKGKIVEAMRYGVPTVTTPIGAEGIGDGELALFVADEASAFAEQVINAYTDVEKWNAAAKRQAQAVIRHFSKETARDILLQDMPAS